MSMQKELVQLGEALKERRLAKNLSLKEIENATSIRMNFLSAIEEGHMGKLISPIYAQGFIKKYASFLDLDPEELVLEHPAILKILHEKLSENAQAPQGVVARAPVEAPRTVAPMGESKGFSPVVWIAISALFLLTGWFVARYFDLI